MILPQVILLAVVVFSAFPSGGLGLDNGLGLMPQMGWNSWNHFHCSVTEDVVKKTADDIVSLGLDKAGYKYVNVDDCWAKSRGDGGVVQPDPDAFPDFQGMINYVQSKGLYFGLYSDAGTKTCAGRPGSLGYEEIDAKTYAAWKVDYLKYDNCNNNNTKPEMRYPVMRDALNKTGRPIFFSMCEWGQDDPATWAPKVGNSWRTTGDIGDSWGSMIGKADQNDKWASYAGPGGWNDPDMLEIGNGGMSTAEYETHMSLWSLMKAPLLIGCDLSKISNDTLRILKNPEVIAVNQDTMGKQGKKLKVMGSTEAWGGPLVGDSYVVALVNRGTDTAQIKVDFADLGLSNNLSFKVRDLWRQVDMGMDKGSVGASVPSHGVVMYKLSPV